MKIALTGHSGFVGSILLEVLSKNHEVITFGRHKFDKFFDLTMDYGALEIDDSVDVVIHSAYDFNNETLPKSLEINALGSLKLFEKSKLSGVKKFIYISSQSAHEGSVSNYGITKYVTEKLLARDSYVTIARLGYVYDENGNHNLKKLGKKILGITFFPIPYSPKQRYFPTSVRDISAGIEYLLVNDPQSSIISIMGDGADLKATIDRADFRTPKVFIYFPLGCSILILEFLRWLIKSDAINRNLDSLRSLIVLPSMRANKWQEL